MLQTNPQLLPPDMLDTLKKRGWSKQEIAQMSPRQIPQEMFAWHLGYPQWADQAIEWLQHAQRAQFKTD